MSDPIEKNSFIDYSYVDQFSAYYERVKNYSWMKFRIDCRSHLFGYKCYVQGIKEAEKEITALKERESKLVEALKHYGCIDNWHNSDMLFEHSCIEDPDLEYFDLGNFKPDQVGGKKAREVLKELGVEI